MFDEKGANETKRVQGRPRQLHARVAAARTRGFARVKGTRGRGSTLQRRGIARSAA